jgi:integrase
LITNVYIQDRWRDSSASKRDQRKRLKPTSQRCTKETRWRAQVRAEDGALKSAGYHATEAQARQAGQEKLQQLKEAGHTPLKSPTIANALEAYLDERGMSPSGKPLEPVYVAELKRAAQVAIDAGCDDMTGDDFSAKLERTIATLKKTDGKPLSASQKRKYRTLLRAMVTLAYDRRWITYDPLIRWAKRAGNLRSKTGKDSGTVRRRAYTIPELRSLVSDRSQWKDHGKSSDARAALKAARNVNKDAAEAMGLSPSTFHYLVHREPEADEWFLFVAVLVYTGMRSGEAQALRWRHIDPDKGWIHLPADHPGNKMERDRHIRIQPELLELLKATSKPIKGEPDYLMPEVVREVSMPARTKAFKNYCKRHGVELASSPLHAVRHSFCSLATAMGASSSVVMDSAGHSDAKVAHQYSSSAHLYLDDLREQGWGNYDPYAPRFFLRGKPPGAVNENKN